VPEKRLGAPALKGWVDAPAVPSRGLLYYNDRVPVTKVELRHALKWLWFYLSVLIIKRTDSSLIIDAASE
jgi:hypothetical protein